MEIEFVTGHEQTRVVGVYLRRVFWLPVLGRCLC
jgi:hypothetical protein